MSFTPKAIIVAVQGEALTENEKRIFSENCPMGYILFQRNCKNPGQLKALVNELYALNPSYIPFILVDQEGGRVARLKEPHWEKQAAAGTYAPLGMEQGTSQLKNDTKKTAELLASFGFNVNCAPVLDVPVKGAHQIIGDRAYSDKVDEIIHYGSVVIDTLLEGSIIPVIKHIPGHGRAVVDSHQRLPTVTTDVETLKESDFKTFKEISKSYQNKPVWAMTAHILFKDIDEKEPTTISAKIIEDIIRKEIGFDGFLITDCLSMKALNDPIEDLVKKSIQAGCDAALYSGTDPVTLESVLKATPMLSDRSMKRLEPSIEMVKLQTILNAQSAA